MLEALEIGVLRRERVCEAVDDGPGVRDLGDEALRQAVALEAPLQLAVLLPVERRPERPPGQSPEG